MTNTSKILTPEDFALWMKRMNLSKALAAELLGSRPETIRRYLIGKTPLRMSVAHHAELIEAVRAGRPFFQSINDRAKTEMIS